MPVVSLVAIVGRPNVGKSTLFNRIIGRRTAIVDDAPGVTRDRHYAHAEWSGRVFTLVDTGGYVPESEDVFETAIREQVQIAIDEAAAVLFVVDGKAGLVPTDLMIAELLRKSGKRVLLVVSKIDSDAAEPGRAEFYRLGLGEPVSVSGLAGRKVGDLLDELVKGLHETPVLAEDTRFKIAVIGKPNVGKSSLVNALLQQERNIVTDIPGTTRDSVDSVLRFHGEEILLVDTAGLRRRSKIKESVEFYSTLRTLKAIDRCDVAVVLVDAQEGLQHQDLRIIETALERNRPTLLAVNKWDLVEKDDRTAAMLEKALKERLRVYDYVPVIFISAFTRQRIYKLVELARAIDAEQNKRVSTSRLNELLGADIKMHPPRSRSGREVKINYVTQVRAKPPVFAFFCNDPTLVDEQYKRYLENRIRHHFTFAGVPLVLTFKPK